jgi:hypothetical protein
MLFGGMPQIWSRYRTEDGSTKKRSSEEEGWGSHGLKMGQGTVELEVKVEGAGGGRIQGFQMCYL